MISSQRIAPKGNGPFAGAGRFLARALLIGLASILANCDGRPVLSDVDIPAENEQIVFGRVKVVTGDAPDGVEWKKSSIWTSFPFFKVLVLPQAGSEAITYRLENDGTFYWSLLPGEYSVAGFYWAFSGNDSNSGRIWAAFTVSPDQPATYLGTLTLLFSRNRYAVRTEDDYETSVARFKERFPDIATEPDRSLFDRGADPTQAEFERNVCAPDWEVGCERDDRRNYRGVRPISPSISGVNFPEVTSLRPTFEWQPSTRSDVSYDLVIYDTFAFRPKNIVTDDSATEYMHGPVALYREDLKENRYDLDFPLKPNTRYFWSVRLRQGNVVSNWSTFGYDSYYFAIVIAGRSMRSNILFNFRTPEE